MKKVRESNFELLRCILMLMVVLVHYNNSGMGKAFDYVEPESINYYFVYFVESLAIIGTNGFVLLTGYFSWKKESVSLRKPIGLLIYVAAYKFLMYVVSVLVGCEPFAIRKVLFSIIPDNWYITLFIVLLVLSPYINTLIGQMSKQGFRVILILMFALFSVWPTILDIAGGVLGIPTVGMYTVSVSGADSGYSVINFSLLYMVGAFLAKYNALNYSLIWDCLGYIVCTFIIFLEQLYLCAGWSYANPFVICSAVCFFNIFRKIHLTSSFINTMSKASLGVFLIHTQSLISTHAWSKCGIDVACKGEIWGLAWNMMWCCFLTYLLCVVLDTVCRRITRPVSRILDRIHFLNIDFIGSNTAK